MKTKLTSIIHFPLTFILITLWLWPAVGAQAIPIAQALPVGSADILRNFALGQVTHGSRVVTAPSLDYQWPESITYTSVIGSGAEEVLDKLFDVEFKYRLINPVDTVTGYVYLYDTEDNLLFYGIANFTAADLEKGKPQYNIWMQEIPLTGLKDIESAEVLAIDEKGQTARRYPLNIKNGHPLFPPWMAGAPNGIMVIRSKDGLLTRYDLSNPVTETPGTTTEGESAWKIDGHYVFGKFNCPVGTCSSPATVTVKITELWTRPTVLLRFTEGQIIIFDVMGFVQNQGGTNFERPFGFRLEQVNGPLAGGGILSTTESTQVSLPTSGDYRIYFEWKEFGESGTLYTGPEFPEKSEVISTSVTIP